MNILPKLRRISTFQKHIQTLKKAGIDEDAIIEICGCEPSIAFQHLYDLSLSAVNVIRAFDDEGIHELEADWFYHFLAMEDFKYGAEELQKALDYAENCTERIKTYIVNQEGHDETFRYNAIFIKENDGRYSVLFPDFDCATCGDSLSHANRMAQECLTLQIRTMRDEQHTLPEPSEQTPELLKKTCLDVDSDPDSAFWGSIVVNVKNPF